MPTIAEATKGKVLPATEQRGPLQVWLVKLDDGREAELSRKPDSPAPTGEVTVSETQYGLRAKLALQGSRNGGGGRSPAETKSIVRQHSQEMALRWMHLQLIRGKVPDDFDYEQLTPVIEWFQKDATG